MFVYVFTRVLLTSGSVFEKGELGASLGKLALSMGRFISLAMRMYTVLDIFVVSALCFFQ